MLSFECIKNEKSVYFLLTSAFRLFFDISAAQFVAVGQIAAE